MENHFSILGWRIPWTEEPGGVTKSQTRLSDEHFHNVSAEGEEWNLGTSLAVQRLRLCTSTAGTLNSNPDPRTKILHDLLSLHK